MFFFVKHALAVSELGEDIRGLPVFHRLRKRSGNRNASNAGAHSLGLGHDLAAERQHHPGRIHRAYTISTILSVLFIIRSCIGRSPAVDKASNI